MATPSQTPPKAKRELHGTVYEEYLGPNGARFANVQNFNGGPREFISHEEYDTKAEGLRKLSNSDRAKVSEIQKYEFTGEQERRKKNIRDPLENMNPTERKAFNDRLQHAGVALDANTLLIHKDMASGGSGRKEVILAVGGRPCPETASLNTVRTYNPAHKMPVPASAIPPGKATAGHTAARPMRGFASVAMMATTAAVTAIAIPALQHLGVGQKQDEPAIRMTELSRAADGLHTAPTAAPVAHEPAPTLTSEPLQRRSFVPTRSGPG